MGLQEGTGAGAARSLIMRHPQGVCLVFGLDWLPIVGGEPEKLALRRARSLNATHFLVLGEPGAVVGCSAIQFEADRTKSLGGERARRLYSAAALFAMKYPIGIVAGIYHLPASGYWMVAVNAGRVLAQTDRWFATLDQADAAMAALGDRFPNLQAMPLEMLTEAALPDWAREAPQERVRLKRLSMTSVFWTRFSFFAFFVASSFGIWALLSPAPVPLAQSAEHADTQWKAVMDRFATSHPIHHPTHMFQVLNAWKKTPLQPGGWRLNQVLCESSNLDWHCAARYQRFKKLARSEQLDAAKPEGWHIELIDMDHAVLRWQVLGAASLFEPLSPAIPLKEWMSYLQGVTPVFDSIQIGTGTQIILPAPLDEQGMAFDRPAYIKPLKRRSIAIKGPLRSMVALKGLSVPVRWRSVHLEVGTPRGRGISSSGLMVHLLGEVFEISE